MFPMRLDELITLCRTFSLIPPVCFPLPLDASCTDKMDELDDADVSRGPAEPAVKRERIEMNHPLQEM